MRAVIYCRISLDATGEALGVTRQLEDCRALIDQLGWTLAAEPFIDNDISATSGKTRPEYRRMLASIKAGEVDAVFAWHTDRLYRKLRDLEELIEACERNEVMIKTCRAGEFDISTPTGRMLARILAAASAGEGEIKSDRWRRSIRQRRERGDLPKMGPRLYGYDRSGSIISEEADQIRRAADELLDGVPITRVAHNLNARGSRTTLGNEWSRPSASKLLRNGRLAGRSMLNGSAVAVGTWEPILGEETFEQLQSILDARRGTTERRPRVALLLGLVTCSLCGTKMVTGGRSGRGDAPPQRTYRCPTMPGMGGCGRVALAAEPVEEIVEAYAQERLRDPRVTASLEELARRTGTATAEAIQLEERLRELEAELDRPGTPVAAIARAMERTQERLADLRSTPLVATLPKADTWPEDLARRAKLVRLIVDRVEIAPARFGGRFDEERVSITPRHTVSPRSPEPTPAAVDG